ncbi:hypothetical protein [Sneathiella chinensis]|uniref:Uncharacterized protein n=1 Tax=Sneathiella chinensis TaxID=349750 RepID=A0ABQ5U0F6_9PROT|nr:hypothetical protein [Sneathiella chinensis]GLQ04803.1 hypothetical protein GCM10007924_00240 [Sneathiella chinensis]
MTRLASTRPATAREIQAILTDLDSDQVLDIQDTGAREDDIRLALAWLEDKLAAPSEDGKTDTRVQVLYELILSFRYPCRE